MDGDNPYRVRPFLVAVLDSEALRRAGRDGHAPTRKARSVVVFLGPVGKNVRIAAERAGLAASHKRRPAPTDAKLLSREYGPRWAALLGHDLFAGRAVGGDEPSESDGPDEPDDLAALAEDSIIAGAGEVVSDAAMGGADDDFGDLSDFGKTVDAVRREKRAARRGPGGADALIAARDLLRPYMATTVAMYPTDTMADLSERVWVATEIPPWRLNIALERPGEELQYAYDLYLSDVRASIDPSTLYDMDAPGDSIAGVLPDRRLEQRRTRARVGEPAPVQVRPYDEARQLEYRPGSRAHLAWAFDILTAFDLAAAEKAMHDTYARDLLYYGAVLKFWPRIEGPEVLAALFAGREIEGSRVGRLPATHADALKRSDLAQDLMEPVYGAVGRRRPPAESVSDLVLEGDPGIASGYGDATVEVVAAFDRVATSTDLPAATLALSATTVGGLAAAGGFRRPNRKSRLTVKRHASSYIGSVAREVGSLEKAAAAILSRGGMAPSTASVLVKEDTEFAAVSLAWKTGTSGSPGLRCYAHRKWSDTSEGLSLEEASEDLNAFAAEGLAALGVRTGTKLAVNLTPRALAANWSWAHALTSEGFRELRAQARRLEAAGFATTRAAQQPNVIALEWHRGVWDFAPDALARAFSHSKAADRGVANLYAGGDLIRGVMLRAFAGRIVRLIHRATEVRLEVAGVAPTEFDAIRSTLSAFFGTLRTERILHAQTLSQMDLRSAAAARGKTRRLRKLQETDPKLYDLRLYSDERGKIPVYAVLCQGDRQPMIYTDTERRRLPDRTRRRLVKYWNYTSDGPAFYDCGGPGSAYPYLGFRAGVHPLGYCLPCCKKAPPDAPSASASARETHRRCLAAVEDPDEDVGERTRATGEVSAAERHILIFGKDIPADRLGAIPVRLQTLFAGDEGPSAKLNLLGVMQQTPSIPEAGFFYSLAAALRRTPEEFAERLAETAERLEESLGYFANGSAAGVSPSAVAAAYRALATGEPEPGAFSPGGAMEETWKALTSALVREIYQVAHVTFVAGEIESGERSRETVPITFEADRALLGDGTIDVPLVVTVSRGGVVNPLVALGGRRGVVRSTRRIFTRGAPVDSEKMSGNETVARAISELVEDGRAGVSRGAIAPLTAKDLVGLSARADFKIGRLYGDLENRYHGGVVLWGGSRAWVPLAGDEVVADEGEWPKVTFGARGADDAGTLEELKLWLDLVGRSAVRAEDVRPLVGPDGKTTGFVGRDGLVYHHGATETDLSAEPVKLPYDPREIDQALVESRGEGSGRVPYAVAALARAGRLKAGRFRLFVAEFATASRSERGLKIRKAVERAVRGARFSNSQSLAAMRRALDEILAGHPADAGAVRRVLLSASGSRGFLKEFGARWFEFDAATFHRARAAPTEKGALDTIRDFMKKRVSLGEDDPAFDPPNFYRACGGAGEPKLPPPKPVCRSGRLAMPAELMDPYCRLLLDEIVRPMEINVVLSAATGVFEPFLFTERPYEELRTAEL